MHTTTTLRRLVHQPGIIVAPGAYDCLTAKLIEREGFAAVYMTGGGTAVTRVGKADLGFTTMSEMLDNARTMTATIKVPLIADADTGYGGLLNVYRTIREYEAAGVAALHIEDQVFPKRCGHLDGKDVVPIPDMVTKIRAACDARTDDAFVIIVRTDALAVTDLDDTLRRCVAFAEAGADDLFVEALRNQTDIDRVRHAVDVPLLFNFVEHGKSPMIPVPALEQLGFKMVIFPGSIMLSVCTLAQRVLRAIRTHGTTANLLDDMVSVQDFFEIMELKETLDLADKWPQGVAIGPECLHAVYGAQDCPMPGKQTSNYVNKKDLET